MRSMNRGRLDRGILRKAPRGAGAVPPSKTAMPLIKRDMKRRNATDDWDGKSGKLGGRGDE